MRSISLLIVSLVVPSTMARRWRFATAFPGHPEPSLPEPVHKPYEDLEKLEKVFDTKQTSQQSKKKKGVAFGAKTESNEEKDKKSPSFGL